MAVSSYLFLIRYDKVSSPLLEILFYLCLLFLLKFIIIIIFTFAKNDQITLS